MTHPSRLLPSRSSWLLAAIVAASVVAGACSADDPAKEDTTTTQSTTTASGGAGGTGGSTNIGGGGLHGVAISPKNPVMKVELPLANNVLQFSCLNEGNMVPDATWALGHPDVGTISDTGVFMANGEHPGEVDVSCQVGEQKAETKLKVIVHALDDTGGVSPADKDLLKGPPGGSDPSWTFVYPYDKTVFPRGIPAPEIHLTSGTAAATAYYVQIHAELFDYEGFFGGGNAQLAMTQAAWKALSSAGGGSDVEVRVSKLAGAQKYGPISRVWRLAPGKLHGTIYYNTYNSPLAGAEPAMMRIKGDAAVPEVLVGNCTACHSVAADGSTAAAANFGAGMGGVFDLSGGNVNPPLTWAESMATAFAGLYPKNGEVLLINCGDWGGAPTSELRTKTGMLLPNTGIEAYCGQTPVFSHDGLRVAFTDKDPLLPWEQGGPIAMMDYDPITQKFSNYQVLAMPPEMKFYSWPAFTPDGKYVVFEEGEEGGTYTSGPSRLFAVDVQTKMLSQIATLNGDGYVPQGARDENKNYEPSFAPIASGGYYWLMFTSRRTYGTKLVGSEQETKRLWVSAWDPQANPGVDPTSPPFYLGGQELVAPNSRGFWALDPCKQDGAGCGSGDECCSGFCNPQGDPPEFLCGPNDGQCSDEFEACDSSADCCEGENLECVNGVCSLVIPR